MKYAIIQTGGKQYRVTEGQTLQVEKLPGEIGAELSFQEVLLASDENASEVGTPYLPSAKVTAIITKQARGPKIEIIKFKRRKHHMKRQGHRQFYTGIKIKRIEFSAK